MAKHLMDVIEEEAASPLEERLAITRRERDTLKRQRDAAYLEMGELRQLLGFQDSVTKAAISPPKWTQTKKVKKVDNRAIVTCILSDSHWDEVIRPEEVGYINKYDREIGVMRLHRWRDKLIELTRDYISGVSYEGAVVMLGGDMFSGLIHEELKETNEDTLFGSILFWGEELCGVLESVAEEFGKLYVPGVVGNHGRMTRKPRSKLRARDNADWFLYHMVEKHFRGDERVTVDVGDDTDILVPVYGVTHLLTHGDQTTGGGGIGGIWPPIKRMAARKQERYAPLGKAFDILVCGHWHQLVMAPEQGLIVNGSSKAFDEYAAVSGFRPERPQQAMWLTTPEHGVTISAPIITGDRVAEGW